MHHLRASTLAALWFALAPPAALAGAGPYTEDGAGLVPTDEPRVRLAAQEANFLRTAGKGGSGHWLVEASYRLENLVEERVTVLLGLPEPTCPPEIDCGATSFDGLRATVRGEPASVNAASADPGHPENQDIARVYGMTVVFAPEETVEVALAYWHALDEKINGGETLTHLARAATGWAGPVSRSQFVVDLPFLPWGLAGAWLEHLEAFEERSAGEGSAVQFIFGRTEFEPDADLQLYIGPDGPSVSTPPLIAECPAPGELFRDEMRTDAAVATGPTLLPDTAQRCEDAVYAHHGRPFADAATDHAFYGASGLRIVRPDPTSGQESMVFARNPDYSLSLLSEAERAYIAAIRARADR